MIKHRLQLLQQEWKAALDIYSGREAAKMGVSKNGLSSC
jgi:hypothetical protein